MSKSSHKGSEFRSHGLISFTQMPDGPELRSTRAQANAQCQHAICQNTEPRGQAGAARARQTDAYSIEPIHFFLQGQ